MQKKKFLFFPLEVGLAHLTRSLAIAEALQARGHDVLFTLPERKAFLAARTQVKTVDISPCSHKDDMSLIKNHKNFLFVLSLARAERKLIRKYQPDCCVVDYRISAVATATSLNLPTVFITGSTGLPYGCYIPNPNLPQPIYKAVVVLADKIIQTVYNTYFRVLLKIIKRFGKKISKKEMLERLLYIIPETREYLPSKDHTLSKHYVGSINWSGFKVRSPKWLKQIKPNKKTIYLTFGGTGFDKNKLIKLSKTLVDQGYRVIVSTGKIANPKDFPAKDNLFVEDFLPGEEVSAKVDLVVCHGGYGTIMQATEAGVPVVVIPYNPDQIMHGLRFQELGLGKCLFKLTFRYLLDFFKFDWLSIEDKNKLLSVTEIIREIEAVLKQRQKYLKSIKKFQKQLPKYNTSHKAAELIEEFLN